MKFLMIIVLFFGSQAFAEDSKYDKNVRECLKHWKKTPFNSKNLDYKTISSSVSVFGAGSDIVDDVKTKRPKLVFIKPSVNVMGGKLIQLKNPTILHYSNSFQLSNISILQFNETRYCLTDFFH